MPRLPVPGSDNGTWGDVLNEYLSVSLNSEGTLKDDIIIADNVADGALPQAKITNLVTTLSSKVDTTDVRLNLDYSSIYPVQGYGFFATSEIPTVCDEGAETSVGSVVAARIWVPANNAITNVSVYVSSSATLGVGGVNGFAVYTDAGTLVTQTTSDDSLWASTGWKTKALNAAIAAQTTSRFVYACLLVSGYAGSGPHILWNTTHNSAGMTGANPGTSNKRSFFIGGQSSFPASFNPTSAGSTNSYLPFFGLS